MTRDPTAFYSAVASLLPVLVLTFVVETRGISEGTSPNDKLALRLLGFVMLVLFAATAVVGEALCLHVLIGGTPTRIVRGLVLTMLFLSSFCLVWAILYRATEQFWLPRVVQFATGVVLSAATLIGLLLSL